MGSDSEKEGGGQEQDVGCEADGETEPDDWRFEPVAEAAEDFEALLGSAAGDGDGWHAPAAAAAKRSSRSGPAAGTAAVDVVVIADSEDDDLVPHGMAAPACDGWGAPLRFPHGEDAGVVEPGSSPAEALSPRSPQPNLQQQTEAQRSAERPPVQHRRLFPGLTESVLSWGTDGKVQLAPPPCLHALLAGVAEGEEGAPLPGPARQQLDNEACDGAERVPTPAPSQQPVAPPLLAAEGLLLHHPRVQQPGDISSRPLRQLLRFDDPVAHRWAFVAAFGAQEQEQPGAAGQQGAIAVATADQGARDGNVLDATATAAAKLSGKGGKPRKRKQAVSGAAAAAGAGGACAAKPKKRNKVGRHNTAVPAGCLAWDVHVLQLTVLQPLSKSGPCMACAERQSSLAGRPGSAHGGRWRGRLGASRY